MSRPERYSTLTNPEILGSYRNQDRSKEDSEVSEIHSASRANVDRRWQWARPTIEGVAPSPRGGHTATLAGASVVVFGGHYYGGKKQGFTYLNDTIVLDVNENKWVRPRLNGTPPSPRYGHTAVLAGSRIVVFGGRGENGFNFRDLHALDPVTMTWYQGPDGGNAPSGRLNHTATLVGTKMYVFGGWNGESYFNDLHILDLTNMGWTQPETTGYLPVPRMGHTAVLIGTNILVQGGFYFDEEKHRKSGMKMGSFLKDCYLNDLRVLDTETLVWSRLRVSGTPPRPCYNHSMNVSGSDIIVLGGYGVFGKPTSAELDYFVVLNTDTMSWNKGLFTGNPPPNRYGHSTTVIEPHILIFGGWESTKAMNDVIVLRDMTTLGDKSASMNS
jgi:N-acetylneuraminic acid mutarotase